MVNDVILKYFKDNRVKHSVEDLKKGALKGGYLEKDIDEAIALSVSKVDTPKIKSESVGAVVSGDGGKVSGKKYMKFAGILGIVFLVLGVLNFIVGFFGVELFATSSTIMSVIMIVVAFVLIVLVCYYFYGFIKMGKVVESKLLRVSAMMNIILIITIFVLAVVSIVWTIFVTTMMSNGLSGATSEFDAIADSTGTMTGNAIAGGLGMTMSGWFFLVLGIFFLFILFVFLARLLFSIALIKVGKTIKFARIAGILGLVLLAVAIISYGFQIYMAMNFFSLAGTFLANLWFLDFLFWVGIAVSIVGFVMLLLESLALFDASKKFEK